MTTTRSDRTAEVARAAGAVVRTETLQGKGHVIRRMFADIEADAYVLVDGDATYHAALRARRWSACCSTSGSTWSTAPGSPTIQAAYRPGHRFGNRVLTGHGARASSATASPTCSPATGCSRAAS